MFVFSLPFPLSLERSFLLVVGFSQATSERRSQYQPRPHLGILDLRLPLFCPLQCWSNPWPLARPRTLALVLCPPLPLLTWFLEPPARLFQLSTQLAAPCMPLWISQTKQHPRNALHTILLGNYDPWPTVHPLRGLLWFLRRCPTWVSLRRQRRQHCSPPLHCLL